jgi:Restriction endonuclease
VLNAPSVPRAWIEELHSGNKIGAACPRVWVEWINTGKAMLLRAEKISRTRKADQQLGRARELAIAAAVHEHFSSDPIRFEYFAADLVRLMDPNVISLDVTRPSRDGGRDALGLHRIGMDQNCVTVDFAMEAKCFAPQSGLGVKVISRLISRLRHRQFGILVTTTYLADQAYQEIVEDQHPIIVCAGGDIAELLTTKRRLKSADDVAAWLVERYPMTRAPDETTKAGWRALTALL